MATSSEFSTSNQYVKYTISITQNSQNVTNNTSNVTVSVRFYRTNTGYTTYGTGTVYCKINGVTYSASVTPDDKITSGGIVLFTKTLNITHNANGSKTLAASAWINHNVITSSEQSYSQTLTTIPRATTPTLSASSVNMGSALTITLSSASTAFTHDLTYSFAGSTGTVTTGVKTSYAWTVPLALADKIPNATSGTVTITCKTYNGSSLIGTKTVSFVAKVPSSVVPTISSVTASEAVSGLAAQFGGFVQSKSKVSVNISAAGAYSSTIKSYKSTLNGATYTESSFTTGTINKSGSLELSVTVTDSRGRTATNKSTITLYAWEKPRINSFTVARCNADGTANDDGKYLKASYSYSISPVNNKNTNTQTVQLESGAEWATLGSKTEGYTATSSYISTRTFDTESSFNIRLAVKDYFGTTYALALLSTAFTLIDYRNTGKGLALGKVSEKDGLEVALDTYFDGKVHIGDAEIKDFVVESGKSGIWLYEKWNSGIAKCWGAVTVRTTVANAWGNMFTSTMIASSQQAFPFTFAEVPNVVAALMPAGNGGMIMAPGSAAAKTTTTSTGAYEIMRAVKAETELGYTITYSAVGRWK